MDTDIPPAASLLPWAALLGAAVLALTLTACSGSSTAATSNTAGPVPAPAPASAPLTESNPPGDIPDNQAFVPFTDPSGTVSVKVPEGWARTTDSAGATTFTDKLNSIEVVAKPGTPASSPADVRTTLVPELTSKVSAFTLGDVQQITRSGARTVLVTYQGDSAQDPVTGKVVRDAFELYVFSHNGHQVALTLAGPVNADNVDPWRIVSDSVTWP